MNRILILVIITVICLISQFEPTSQALTWDKTLIANGQWWRIVSGNFTHTNLPHLAMNMLALWLINFMFQPNSRQFVLISVVLSAMVGIGLIFTDLQRYVGLSGTLHGIFAYYALGEAVAGRRSSWLLVGSVIVKVMWEQLVGPSPTSASLIKAPIAIDAHLIGLLAGLILLFITHTLVNKRSPHPHH
jgi:rhomboid family GlyGly-CTERM serine protease